MRNGKGNGRGNNEGVLRGRGKERRTADRIFVEEVF